MRCASAEVRHAGGADCATQGYAASSPVKPSMDTVPNRPWTAEAFLAREYRQEGKHAFDGRDVIPMTGHRPLLDSGGIIHEPQSKGQGLGTSGPGHGITIVERSRAILFHPQSRPIQDAFMIGVNDVVSGAKPAKTAMTEAAEKANASIRGQWRRPRWNGRHGSRRTRTYVL